MTNKAGKVIKKYIEFITTKIRILWEQKVFSMEDIKVKYIFKKKKDAGVLVVVLSACTRKGLKARYNYVKTLNGLHCNRLYILDDYGKDCRGSYYMGYDCNFKEEEAVKALINKIMEESKPEKVVFCGSSKGGYSALNFGTQYPNSVMIVGAPQYYLTSYLVTSGNLYTLEHIIGNRTEERDARLEHYLENKLKSNPYIDTQQIFLHFSDKEHTYEEHIRHMLKDLEECGYHVEKDVADYTNHSDISLHFPDFLRKHIGDVIEK